MNQIHVKVASVCECLKDRLFGDLMEHHPACGHLGLENLNQVPADAFSLAVLISCQYQLVSSLELALNLGDHLLLGLIYDIFRLVSVFDIYAKIILGKCPDVSV